MTLRQSMRFITYHYPFLPFRPRLFPWTNSWSEIPDGSLLPTHAGIQIRSRNDAMYRSLYHFGDYEPFNTKVYRRLVAAGDVVLDIGTNFGWYSTLFARWVGTAGRVHAFEPVPFIHEYAKDALSLNGHEERVALNFFGLGRKAGQFTVYTFKGLPHGHATATDLGRDDAIPHQCRIETLDDYCRSNGVRGCSFLKIDVEGHELEVFEGGRDFLGAADAPVISFEINSDCLKNRGIVAGDVVKVLRECGYEHFYSFSIRQGFRKLADVAADVSIDCLAFKSARRAQAMCGVSTGRLLR